MSASIKCWGGGDSCQGWSVAASSQFRECGGNSSQVNTGTPGEVDLVYGAAHVGQLSGGVGLASDAVLAGEDEENSTLNANGVGGGAIDPGQDRDDGVLLDT